MSIINHNKTQDRKREASKQRNRLASNKLQAVHPMPIDFCRITINLMLLILISSVPNLCSRTQGANAACRRNHLLHTTKRSEIIYVTKHMTQMPVDGISNKNIWTSNGAKEIAIIHFQVQVPFLPANSNRVWTMMPFFTHYLFGTPSLFPQP